MPTLPLGHALLDLLAHARVVTQLQIIKGLEPDRLARALNGEHVGSIVCKDDAS